MRVGIAQVNSQTGDFDSNARKIVEYIQRAADKRCKLVVFPEMALCGYWPADLLERKVFLTKQLKALRWIERSMPKTITAIVGLVTENTQKRGKALFNSAAVICKGKKTKFIHKSLLPLYDVFDDGRHLSMGSAKDNLVVVGGKKILVTICEDIWGWPDSFGKNRYVHNPLVDYKNKKIDLVVNLSASPFSLQKEKLRLEVAKKTNKFLRSPIVYVNRVGAQDEIVYDGASFALSKQGKVLSTCLFGEEDLNVFDFVANNGGIHQKVKTSEAEKLRHALVVGIRDFVLKNNITRVHLGLSGGIDSAVVACLATDALGPQRVTCVAMPGPYSAGESLQLAKQLAINLSCKLIEAPIGKSYDAVVEGVAPLLKDKKFGIAHENMQARLRGMFLMALANSENSLLLATGNKSEMATGYCTLYGDMCGGLAPIADLLKREVYAIAKLYNAEVEIIPERIITRPPTAELRANQKDQDSLPEYDLLDAAVENLVVHNREPKTEIEKFTWKKIITTEFKRWQAAPVLRVSERAFGRGRRYPITHKLK